METVVQVRANRNRSVATSVSSAFSLLCASALIIFADSSELRILLMLFAAFSAVALGRTIESIIEANRQLKSLPPRTRLQTAEDRLDQLERLKRRDMVTPEEYAAKRLEILKDL